MRALDIFAYDDYREVLRTWFELNHQDTHRKGVSAFARRAGCAPSHVRNILVGARNLPPELIRGFQDALGLSGAEADYFSWLVQAVHGDTELAREDAIRRVSAARTQRGHPQIPAPRRLGRPPKVAQADAERRRELEEALIAMEAAIGHPDPRFQHDNAIWCVTEEGLPEILEQLELGLDDALARLEALEARADADTPALSLLVGLWRLSRRL